MGRRAARCAAWPRHTLCSALRARRAARTPPGSRPRDADACQPSRLHTRRAAHAQSPAHPHQLAQHSLPTQGAGKRGTRRAAHAAVAGLCKGPAARAAPQRMRLVQHVQHAVAEGALCARARTQAGRRAAAACCPEHTHGIMHSRASEQWMSWLCEGIALARRAARACASLACSARRRRALRARRPPRCRGRSGRGPLVELPRTAVMLRASSRSRTALRRGAMCLWAEQAGVARAAHLGRPTTRAATCSSTRAGCPRRCSRHPPGRRNRPSSAAQQGAGCTASTACPCDSRRLQDALPLPAAAGAPGDGRVLHCWCGEHGRAAALDMP